MQVVNNAGIQAQRLVQGGMLATLIPSASVFHLENTTTSVPIPKCQVALPIPGWMLRVTSICVESLMPGDFARSGRSFPDLLYTNGIFHVCFLQRRWPFSVIFIQFIAHPCHHCLPNISCSYHRLSFSASGIITGNPVQESIFHSVILLYSPSLMQSTT